MKKYRFCALLFALAALGACSDNNKEDMSSAFTLETNRLDFDYTGGSLEMTVTASGSWSVTSTEESWCTVSPSEGVGEGLVTVTVTEIPELSAARTARLLVTSDGLTLSINIYQDFNPETFRIEPTSFALSPAGGDFELTVLSHAHEYDITIVDDWITEVSRSGEAFTGQTIRFHAAANPPSADGAARSGVISVCTADGSCFPVMVEQAGAFDDAHALAMRFTATWCGYCPYMDEAFHKAAAQDARFDYVTFHASSGYPLYFKACEPLVKAYKIEGLPSGVIGGWKLINNSTNTDSNAAKILSTVDDFLGTFPCTAAISATATLSGNRLSVSADIQSTTSEEYKVVAIVLESGIIQAQTYYPTTGGSQKLSDFSHDHVARKLLSANILGDAVQMEAGAVKTLNWSTDLNSAWNPDNLFVAVYLYRGYGNQVSLKAKSSYPDDYITNARIVPVQ